jgi:exodeoxyribonuclease VII large subunit
MRMSSAAHAEQIVDFQRDIWTVSRLNAEARAILEGSLPMLWVQGEISNLAEPPSGHCYFTLKDAGAQVRCALFRQRRRYLQFRPANGQQVLLRARLTLYEARGEFQLRVEHMEPAGEGALRAELERRKRRLAALGLFDEAKKRPLPTLPAQIGLITSPNGAAVHDLLTVLARRLPLVPVLIYPVPVQGEGAAAAICAALALANRRAECDILILARGGGSLEDLMAFNDEALAHAVRASQIPVLTGIGHEIDLSLADLAADRRAPTPSAAAEIAVPAAADLSQRLLSCGRRLRVRLEARRSAAAQRLAALARRLRLRHPLTRLEQHAQTLDRLRHRLELAMQRSLERRRAMLQRRHAALRAGAPQRRLRERRLRLSALSARLAAVMNGGLMRRRQRLANLGGRLDALSPLAVLQRGYAIVTRESDAAVVRSAGEVSNGDAIGVRLRRGALRATVIEASAGDADAPAAGDG